MYERANRQYIIYKIENISIEESLSEVVQFMEPFPNMGERVSSIILTLSRKIV